METTWPLWAGLLIHPISAQSRKRLGIRGIRARAGNIQIGDENVFEHLFPEERFNRWCVGEIHIMDSRIVPNGRRDYFEPGPHTRNLENQMAAVARRISARCRTASTARNKEYKFQAALDSDGRNV